MDGNECIAYSWHHAARIVDAMNARDDGLQRVTMTPVNRHGATISGKCDEVVAAQLEARWVRIVELEQLREIDQRELVSGRKEIKRLWAERESLRGVPVSEADEAFDRDLIKSLGLAAQPVNYRDSDDTIPEPTDEEIEAYRQICKLIYGPAPIPAAAKGDETNLERAPSAVAAGVQKKFYVDTNLGRSGWWVFEKRNGGSPLCVAKFEQPDAEHRARLHCDRLNNPDTRQTYPCKECGYFADAYSAETGLPLFCVVCDTRGQLRDALTMEREYKAKCSDLQAEIDRLNAEPPAVSPNWEAEFDEVFYWSPGRNSLMHVEGDTEGRALPDQVKSFIRAHVVAPAGDGEDKTQ
jgi:hypothetical protein